MDSLTQIVLGAACGEVALGKKIGNKALLFGAIGGTLPDLDVILGSVFFSNEIDELAFHRGFMHSILFACIASLVVGFIVYELYDTGKRKGTTSLKDWIWLFFLSIFTHPILDSFTAYGTQLFLPFSDARVAFNNIAVIDLFYTVPFLICLLVVLFYKRSNPKRLQWTKTGIYISTVYLLLTVGNKLYIDSYFEKSFEEAGIEAERISSQPGLLFNFLWYAVAETDDAYYVQFHSLFDDENRPENTVKIPTNHDLLKMDHPDLQTLLWFSKDFYALRNSDDGTQIIYQDLRFPLLDDTDPESSLFSFKLIQEADRWNTDKLEKRKLESGDFQEYFNTLMSRTFGN
jgi:inner membrane protein